MPCPDRRVTGLDAPAPYAANLEALTFPTYENVYRAVKKTLNVA